MTSHSNFRATDNNRAIVVGTVATVGGGVGNGTVATADDTVIDGTVADTGTVKKQNFHTGLDPVSRTNNSAQPTEFNAVVTAADKVRYAQLFSLDTGSSPVWSVVADTDATDDDRAIDTVTNPDDATVATGGDHLKSSYRQDAGIQTQGQQDESERGRGRRMTVATPSHRQPPAMSLTAPWRNARHRRRGQTPSPPSPRATVVTPLSAPSPPPPPQTTAATPPKCKPT